MDKSTKERCRVLVVDDEPEIRFLVGTFLRRAGYEVVLAANADQALEIFREQPGISLLLTDLIMPGMRGNELAARMRAMRADLPILFITAYRETDLINIPGASCMSKPFTPTELVATVRQALEWSELQHDAASEA